MRRRGSHTASMLKPTVSVVQGQHQQVQQSSADTDSGRDVRRVSEPSLPPVMMINGTRFPSQHCQQQQQQQQQMPTQAINMPCVVAPPQPQLPPNNTQAWHLQPQPQAVRQSQQQQYRSFVSSMDLISPTTSSASTPTASNIHGGTMNPFNQQAAAAHHHQNHLFKSSSHHTSHTAVAGDLLTMSRRALDPPLPNNSQGGGGGSVTKKRSSTMVDTSSSGVAAAAANNNGVSSHQFSFGSGFNRSNSQPMVFNHQYQANNNPPQQQQGIMHPPQHRHSMEYPGSGPFMMAAAAPSSSAIASQDKLLPFPHPASPQCSSGGGFQTMSNNVSSSTICTSTTTGGGNGGGDTSDESYQHHRAIRQCRRSDSFEMMEDG